MKYLIVDASFNGTGIRDKYNGGYLNPKDLNLSSQLISKLNEWLKKYQKEFCFEYINKEVMSDLDNEGKEIAQLLKKELENFKIEYYSDATMIRVLI